ncbi:MAG: hypothetical protein GTO14_23480 [Anaerolineales bacterium]|nr:hypothetical protein [Anaerolineales bacterium]
MRQFVLRCGDIIVDSTIMRTPRILLNHEILHPAGVETPCRSLYVIPMKA